MSYRLLCIRWLRDVHLLELTSKLVTRYRALSPVRAFVSGWSAWKTRSSGCLGVVLALIWLLWVSGILIGSSWSKNLGTTDLLMDLWHAGVEGRSGCTGIGI